MPMPYITPEIIASIREQSSRKITTDLYWIESLSEIRKENPNLAVAIKDTIDFICEKCDIDINTPKGLELVVNMANLSIAVYQAIKQQMICDEL